MPYHLPDEKDLGSCVIKFSLPTDDKWATILIGAVAQLAREENWEPDTGGLTVAEALATAILIRQSVEFTGCTMANIKIGSYEGNDSSSQNITDVGFLPEFVLIWMENNTDTNRGLAIASGNALSMKLGASNLEFALSITDFASSGFRVHDLGGNNSFNANARFRSYGYLALAS